MDRAAAAQIGSSGDISALIEAIEGTVSAAQTAPVWVAFSAGMDSSTLLACAARSARLRECGLRALHVHHGLHADADAWAAHAVAYAAQLDVPCEVLRVRVDARGQGIEAAARSARHAAFQQVLTPDACMLLAHHQEDQAETLLLRVLRGAAVDGLGAMRARRAFGLGTLLRPWLDQPRARLAKVAALLNLRWIEDPANADLRHDRCYLRQQVWPLLVHRFPALGARLARLAEHAASVSDELEQAAQATLTRLAGPANALQIEGLLALSDALFGATLRRFALLQGVTPPGFHELARLRAQVLLAANDANPIQRSGAHEFRRYRAHLFLLPQAQTKAAQLGEVLWAAGSHTLHLPEDLGDWQALDSQGQPTAVPCTLSVRWRRGGERLRPSGGAHTRDLRLIFQERGIPPWQRERIALLFDGKTLLAALGVVHSDELAVRWPGIVVAPAGLSNSP